MNSVDFTLAHLGKQKQRPSEGDFPLQFGRLIKVKLKIRDEIVLCFVGVPSIDSCQMFFFLLGIYFGFFSINQCPKIKVLLSLQLLLLFPFWLGQLLLSSIVLHRHNQHSPIGKTAASLLVPVCTGRANFTGWFILSSKSLPTTSITCRKNTCLVFTPAEDAIGCEINHLLFINLIILMRWKIVWSGITQISYCEHSFSY